LRSVQVGRKSPHHFLITATIYANSLADGMGAKDSPSSRFRSGKVIFRPPASAATCADMLAVKAWVLIANLSCTYLGWVPVQSPDSGSNFRRLARCRRRSSAAPMATALVQAG
jgi:hypothetical protein